MGWVLVVVVGGGGFIYNITFTHKHAADGEIIEIRGNTTKGDQKAS